MKKLILSFLIPFFVDREPSIDFVDDKIERRVMNIVCSKARSSHVRHTSKTNIPNSVCAPSVKRKSIDINCYYSQPI